MSDAVELLLSRASDALGLEDAPLDDLPELGERGRELLELLRRRNGFYAFASSLHVFPLGPVREGYDLETWNSPDLWRFEYGDLADGHVFFAEDAFGNQFSVHEQRIVLFDAETAAAKELAPNIGSWVEEIVARHRYLTGWPLAKDWQDENAPIPPGKRLMPKKPFVIGGEYEIRNLRATDAVEAMRFRGYLATQLRDLPDGATVRLVRTPGG
jgi:hypothetical protein